MGAPSDSVRASLLVERAKLTKALKGIKKLLTHWESASATLSFDGQTATLAVPGLSYGIPARGQWDGQAVFSASLPVMLGDYSFSHEWVPVRIEGQILHIDRFREYCKWNAGPPASQSGPVDATAADRLVEASRQFREALQEIDTGVSPPRNTHNTRIEKAIDRAHAALEEFGITREQIRSLINEHLDRQS
jgi:hypothetical protein